MRITIYIATIGLIFSSCGNIATKKPVENRITVSKEMSKEEIRLDSIKKQEEMIVFGTIRFGMNKDEFEKSKNEFIKKCTVYLDKNKKYSQFKIGDYEFESIEGDFYKDKLYSVTINGKYITLDNYFDQNMGLNYNALLDVLKKKYGNPIEDQGLHKYFDIGNGNHKRTAYWQSGDKIIQMEFLQEDIAKERAIFYLNLHIFQESMIKLAQEDEERKAKIIKENEEQKRQEIIKKGVDVL